MANSFLAGVKGDATKITHRAAFANNAKLYNGSAYDIIPSWSQIERTQPFSFLCVYKKPSTSGNYRLIDSRYLTSGLEIGMYIGDFGGNIYLGLRCVAHSNDLQAGSAMTTKLGANIIIVTYAGDSNANNCNFYINGRRSSLIGIINTLSGSILNSKDELLIGCTRQADSITPGAQPLPNNTLVRKLSLVKRVLTNAEIRKAFNYGTFEGFVANSDFLLDIDFNKTGTADLTTRAGTPLYTINATGTKSYTSFY